MRNPQIPLLETFLAVARLRSFSGAARELGVSTPSVSQAVKQLEEQLHVVLLTRTTRSVAVTEAGRRLVETAGPAMGQVAAALKDASSVPGETVGRITLSVPRAALPTIFEPLLPVLRARHPRLEVEIVVDDRFVDIVAQGFDAGIRLSEAIERDMVQVRLTEAFRFVVVGAPSYLAKHGEPKKPEDLLRHECINLRSSGGIPYAWELERGRKEWRVPVRGSILANDNTLNSRLAERGLGLAYAFEPLVQEALQKKRLKIVLEDYAPSVPGFFLYFPSRAQQSPALKLFVALAKETLAQGRG